MPLSWGYAILDTLTDVPMVCGTTLGGLPDQAAFALPLKVVIAIAGGLLTLTTLGGPDTGRRVDQQAD